MDNEKPKNEQERSGNESQYSWGFRGRDFIKRPNSKVYEPIRYRPNEQCNTDSPAPTTISVKRDFLELACMVAVWAISLVTLLILGLYTYYTGGQWHELIKATNASTLASQTAACALTENERQFDLMFGQIKKQTGAQVTSGSAAKNAAETAKDAFHGSERAYVVLGVPVDDFPHKRTDIPIINSGPRVVAEFALHGSGEWRENCVHEYPEAEDGR